MIIQERYDPVPVAADQSITFTSNNIGGFLASTAGTISIVQRKEDGTEVTLLSDFPVQPGVYYPLPFYLGVNGGTFTAAGGASGLLGV